MMCIKFQWFGKDRKVIKTVKNGWLLNQYNVCVFYTWNDFDFQLVWNNQLYLINKFHAYMHYTFTTDIE